jgi:hypothetical protein
MTANRRTKALFDRGRYSSGRSFRQTRNAPAAARIAMSQTGQRSQSMMIPAPMMTRITTAINRSFESSGRLLRIQGEV